MTKDDAESIKIIKLDPRQLQIYNGLKNIGEEIAAFYLDGVRILATEELDTQSYLLAHIAREIEGGLRAVLVVREKDKQETCEKCNQIVKGEEVDHVTEICIALDVKNTDPLAIKWHYVAKQFPRFAHRHGAWKEPRDATEFKELWNEFEDVLFQLVGTYFNLLERIDRILKYDKPSEPILETLSNQLKVEARHSYFFKNLKSVHWLIPLKEKGHFKPQKNPRPQEVPDQPGFFAIPHWSVLDYLEYVATKNGEAPSNEITDALLEIVNSIISYRDENGERIDNYRTDWIITKIISLFPINRIEDPHIEFIRLSLKSRWNSALVAGGIGKVLLPRLIEKNAKGHILKLLEVMFDYEKRERPSVEYKSIMDDFWLQDTLNKHKVNIISLCGMEAADVAVKKMEAILRADDSHFNTIWISTIEDHPQSRFNRKYEIQLVHFARDVFEKLSSNQIRDKVKDLIQKEHPIFKRLAIHAINHHYKELNDLFWSWEGNPLNETGLKHEIYELLKNNGASLDEGEVDKIMEWIEAKDYYLSDHVKGDTERERKVLAYKKREWLFSMVDTKNPKIVEKYEMYTKINPAEIDHPGLDHWMETWAGEISPVGDEELCAKSNREISEYLNSFKEKGEWRTPTEEGLSDTFRKCVSINPEKFSVDMEPFLNVHRMYQHSLLWGLEEAWRNKKDFEWRGVFAFILKVLEADEFWQEIYGERQYDYRDSIVPKIAELISEGTENETHSFDPELLPIAEKVLFILIHKTKTHLFDMGDTVTSVINSTRWKIFAAMLNYSIRYAELYRKDQENKWVDSIKEEFEKRLNREYEPTLEFSVIVGAYFQTLYYLNKKWAFEKINQIFPKEQESHWKAAFEGYLTYANTIYKEIYHLLRENEHYSKAIQTKFKTPHIEERLIQHICLGYIWGWESIEDENSLISKLIARKDPEQLSEIVSYFWMLREKQIEKQKIKRLWQAIHEISVPNLANPKYKGIISDLSKWLCLIDEIDDEIFEWLKTSAKYVDVNHDAYFFVEYLLAHVDTQADKVGQLYLEMLYAGIYPDFDKEHIIPLIQKLYDKGEKEIADRICNLYGEKGFDFLRELYKTH